MTLEEYLKNSKVYKPFRESKQQRRESSSRKSRTQKVNASLLAKESPTLLESSTKKLYEDKERDDPEHEMSDDRRIPEITTEELQSGKLQAQIWQIS